MRPSDYKIDFDIENVREWLEIACALFVYLYASVGNFCVHFFLLLLCTHAHSRAEDFMSLSDMEGSSRRLKGGLCVSERERREDNKRKTDKLKLICCVVLCNHFNVVTALLSVHCAEG